MGSHSFIHFLAISRWSRLFAFVFGFICLTIITWYFVDLQSSHRQTEWNFKNISNVHSGELTLEPDRIYEVEWEEEEALPTKIYLNGEMYYTFNYLNTRYGPRYYTQYIGERITNPIKIRVSSPTDFGMVFSVTTRTNFNDSFGDFFEDWFKSLSDPVAEVNWTVKDITDSYRGEYIAFDNSFKIIRSN
jgi:hypothetical protein